MASQKSFFFEPQFKEGTSNFIIEKAINKLAHISEHGVTTWISRNDLADMLPEDIAQKVLPSNGSPVFQNDRGLGTRYLIEKDTDKGSQWEYFRLAGYAPHNSIGKSTSVPQKIRDHYAGSRCVFCNKRHTEVDHKDGRKDKSNGVDESSVDSFQPTCKGCNVQKRSFCLDCIQTGHRYDATDMGYTVGYIKGSKKYSPRSPKCEGCYLYDPVEFRQALTL